ncbi:MAG: hypothetical protein JWN57_1771 [Frankiales bacterium]|nr:hypothetical protein [Frankiales bacterium]
MPTRPRRPDPEPLEHDDGKVVLAGTALWVLALVVLGIARLAGAEVQGWWLAMCVCGTALGLIGVRYTQRRRDAIDRDAGLGSTAAPLP